MVINGVRATYRTIETENQKGVTAEVQYSEGAPWERVGGPHKVFNDDDSARRAIHNHVAAEWSKRTSPQCAQ